jgi:transcriptional regulator with XRE-family HTH domain
VHTKAREDLERELHDPEFRKLYGAAEAKSELAVAIAEARHSVGLTQEEMSKKTSVSQPYIAKLEGGEANPTIGTIGSMLSIMNLRLVIETATLLPTPSSAGSADAFVFDSMFKYQPAADTSEIFMMTASMATYPALTVRGRQQGILFPIVNYDFYAPFDEAYKLAPVTTKNRPFEETNVGGHRA